MTVELDDGGDGARAPAARPSRSQIGWSLILIVVGLVVPAVAIALVYRSCREPIARGEVTVTAAGGEPWRVPLMWCALAGPGQRADLTLAHAAAATDRLRVFYDHHHQPRLELVRAGRFQVLDAATCTRLRLAPAHDGPELDDLDLTSGSLDAECRTPGGDQVVIDVWWKHCAAP